MLFDADADIEEVISREVDSDSDTVVDTLFDEVTDFELAALVDIEGVDDCVPLLVLLIVAVTDALDFKNVGNAESDLLCVSDASADLVCVVVRVNVIEVVEVRDIVLVLLKLFDAVAEAELELEGDRVMEIVSLLLLLNDIVFEVVFDEDNDTDIVGDTETLIDDEEEADAVLDNVSDFEGVLDEVPVKEIDTLGVTLGDNVIDLVPLTEELGVSVSEREPEDDSV